MGDESGLVIVVHFTCKDQILLVMINLSFKSWLFRQPHFLETQTRDFDSIVVKDKCFSKGTLTSLSLALLEGDRKSNFTCLFLFLFIFYFSVLKCIACCVNHWSYRP